MPRRRRHQEVEMPEWAIEEATVRERELVAVPIRPEEAKHQAHRYMHVADDGRPWYLREDRPWYTQEDAPPMESVETWYGKLVNQLANYLSDMIAVGGSGVDIDQLVNDWLNSHNDLYRAVMIGVLSQEEARGVLLNTQLSEAVVNATVNIIFA